MKKLNLFKLLVLVQFILAISCSKKHDETSQGTVDFSISFENILKSATISETVKNPSAIYISIKDSKQEYVYNYHKLPLIKIGDYYTTQHIELVVGNYTIEEFIVVDGEDSTMYLTPKIDSKFETFVDNPLPLDFEVSSNNTTSLILEVIPANLGQAIDYGYATFSFTIVNTLEKGLVAYYPFDYNANDASGNGYDGIVNGASHSKDVSINNAAYYHFDGIDDYITMGNVFNNVVSGNDKEFSFSFWIKPSSIDSTNKSIISKNADSNCNEDQRQFTIQKSKDNKIQFIWHSSLTFYSYRAIESSTALTDTTKWYHIAINYDGSIDLNNGLDRADIYIDGKLENKTLTYKNTFLGDIQEGSACFAIGSQVNSNGEKCGEYCFNGFLDEIRIYSRKLLQDEIVQLSRQ